MTSALPATLVKRPVVQHERRDEIVPWHPREEYEERTALTPYVFYTASTGTTSSEAIADLLNTSERDVRLVLVNVLGAGERTDWAQTYAVPCVPENAFVIITSSSQGIVPLPKAISDRLAKLASLPENWDGEGASCISQNTIERVKSTLLKAYSVGKGKLPLPSIAPTSQGMIVCEWTMPSGTELILDVPAADEPPVFLLVEVDHEGRETETEAQLGEDRPIEKLISRLLSV